MTMRTRGPSLSSSDSSDLGAEAPDPIERLARRAASTGPSSASAAASASVASGSFADAIGAGVHPVIARRAAGDEIRSDAGSLVSTASSSSGSALPTTLQRKFEASLGTDLSGVRIHDGAASAAAAASVSARAYTTGNEVHFAAGQYDPGSAAGEHLLAHEVAHTVQQAGAAPRAQFKLEVSAPGDAHEVEADVAADAMVRGLPASVSSGGATLGRVVMRTPSTELASAADRGEAIERGALESAPPAIAGVSNVQDVTQAQRIYDQIEHDLPLLEAGNRTGNSWITSASGIENALVTRAQITSTERTRTALSTFMASAGEQSRELGDYQRQYQQCIVDFARIQAMIEQFQASHPEVMGARNAAEASMMGDAVVRSASGVGPREMGARTRDVAASSSGGAFGRAWDDFRERRTDLDGVSRDIVQRQRQASAQQHAVIAAIDELQAGPVTRVEAGADAREELSDVREQCETVKRWVRRATGAASSRASTMMTAAGAPGVVASAVADHLDDAGDFLTDAAYAQEIQTLETAVARAGARSDSHARDALVRMVRAQMETWHANLRALLDAIQRMQVLRNELRTSTDMVSRAADSSGHRDTAAIARFTGECDVFLAQTRTTIGLGEAEQSAAAYATTDRTTAGEMTYCTASQTYSRGEITYQALEHTVLIAQGYGSRSSEGAGGVNPTVTASLRELRQFDGIVTAFHGQLSRALGLGSTSTSAGTTAADPSMSSATGDPAVAAH